MTATKQKFSHSHGLHIYDENWFLPPNKELQKSIELYSHYLNCVIPTLLQRHHSDILLMLVPIGRTSLESPLRGNINKIPQPMLLERVHKWQTFLLLNYGSILCYYNLFTPVKIKYIHNLQYRKSLMIITAIPEVQIL